MCYVHSIVCFCQCLYIDANIWSSFVCEYNQCFVMHFSLAQVPFDMFINRSNCWCPFLFFIRENEYAKHHQPWFYFMLFFLDFFLCEFQFSFVFVQANSFLFVTWNGFDDVATSMEKHLLSDTHHGLHAIWSLALKGVIPAHIHTERREKRKTQMEFVRHRPMKCSKHVRKVEKKSQSENVFCCRMFGVFRFFSLPHLTV